MAVMKTVEILNIGAMRILQAMESMALIRIEKPETNGLSPGDFFAGALKISDKRYEEMQREVQQGRDEWEQRVSF